MRKTNSMVHRISKLATSLLGLFIVVNVQAWTGGISEGGGDNKSVEHGAAWFLGQQPIRACIQISDNFGITIDQVRSDILSAFAVWDRYMTVKQVHRGPSSELKFRIVSDVKILENCDGSEELTFYLGVENSKVDEAKRVFEKPMAFAHRESYDSLAARSKGFIWVVRSGGIYSHPGGKGSPDWTMTHNFHGIILHELGHIMGVPHIDGTVMDGDWLMSRFQAKEEEFRRASFTKIDYLKELHLIPRDKVQFNGFFGHWACSGELDRCRPLYREAYRMLLGFEEMTEVVTGKIETKVAGAANLEIETPKGVFTFALSPGMSTYFELAEKVFKVWRSTGNTSGTIGEGPYYSQSGYVVLTSLTTPDGRQYPAMIARNSDNASALIVKVNLPDFGWTEIFHADKFQMPY